ncbi:hypothetical protein PYW07_012465 [Mythimna separata]|uniref:Ninjurin-1 n=1 Tax=Mythimna separata TaxID=271217 RepID=A0AAD7YNG8_MYTSE|nr:hypothetical protein PYW07_012465 [Mythimna separata]
MAHDQVKLKILNENPKTLDQSFDDEVERIFGRPPQPLAKPNLRNNTNLMDAERGLTTHGTHFNTINSTLGESDLERPTQPLLEPSRERNMPPLAGPEIDDLDGDPPKDATPFPGIDDGLLETSDKKPEPHHNHDSVPNIVLSVAPDGSEPSELEPSDKTYSHHDGDDAATDGKLPWEHDEPDFPYDVNGLTTRFGDSRPVSPMPGVIPDVNTYQQKKNLAQGMMDLALLSANANQLRYVVESASTHPYFYPSLVFISLSVIIQVVVGIGLIMNSRYDVNDHKERCKADKINNMTVLGIFLITIVNVFITSFSVATPTTLK